MRRFLLLLITIFLHHAVYSDTSVEISDTWINEAPPTVKVLAGYLKIRNNMEDPVILTGADSSFFDHIEFHLTEMNEGVARMKRQEVITIPAHSEFSFSPGEYHLMLFNPVYPVKNGDIVPLEFLFSNGEIIKVTAEVKRSETMSHHH